MQNKSGSSVTKEILPKTLSLDFTVPMKKFMKALFLINQLMRKKPLFSKDKALEELKVRHKQLAEVLTKLSLKTHQLTCPELI